MVSRKPLEGRELFTECFASALKPRKRITVSEWAIQNRQLSAESSVEHGRYRMDRTPFWREVMDVLSPTSPVQWVAVMKGAQLGWTECLLNWIGCIVDCYPASMLYALPDLKMCRRLSEVRLDPMARDTHVLRGKFGNLREPGNKILQKRFPGGVLYFVGGRSAAGYRMISTRYVLMDDLDGFVGDVQGEGDPIKLAERGTRTYGTQRKIALGSTPTTEEGGLIHREFELGDRRHYFVPCPSCGFYQVLVWKQFKWPKGKPKEVLYECVKCTERFPETAKPEIMPLGEWRPEVPERSAERRSYHLPSWYGAIGWRSWPEIAGDFVKTKGQRQLWKVWTNHDAAEPVVDTVPVPKWETIYRRREPYKIGVLPRRAAVVTCGVDVHPNRFEVEFLAWGAGLETWSIGYEVIACDTKQPESWQELQRLVDEPIKTERGGHVRVRRIAVDMGWETTIMRALIAPLPRDRWMPVLGRDQQTSPVNPPKAVELSERGRAIKRGSKALLEWSVGVTTIKAELFSRLALEPPLNPPEDAFPSGFCHFPEYDQGYFKGLLSERQRLKYSRGSRRYVWEVISGRRNEPLDCRVYAMAAAYACRLYTWAESRWDEETEIGRPSGELAARARRRGHEGVRYRDSRDWIR